MRMQCSQKGIDLIKSFEGFSLTAYHGRCDREGLYTIGWGHARGVRPGDKMGAAGEFGIDTNAVRKWEKTGRIPPYARQRLIMRWPERFHDIEFSPEAS